MTTSFVGKREHKVDAKGRVSLPTNFRMVAREGDPNAEAGSNKCRILLMHGRKAKCLMGYSIKSYAKLTKQIDALNPYDRRTEKLKAIAHGNADYFDIDDAGRMGLREFQGLGELGSDVVFFGMGDHFEIWDPSAFEAVYGPSDADEDGDPFEAIGSGSGGKKKKKKKKRK